MEREGVRADRIEVDGCSPPLVVCKRTLRALSTVVHLHCQWRSAHALL